MNETVSDPGEVVEDNPPSLVVGIGASAGGLDAIERFFDNMPNDTGMAFVIVQHLSPDYKSLMDELLARHTKMPILPIKDGIRMQANSVYLLPPRNNIFVENGCLSLIAQSVQRGVNLPIDLFFQSLATDIGKRTVAIILSGTGSDGSRGIPFVHNAGGLVVVQDLDTAGFDGMPRSAATTGVADVICSPDKMPDLILQYQQDPEGFERGQMHYGQSKDERTDRQQLFHLFRRKHGVDFSMYKPTTIDRRLQRRIEMSKCGSLKKYLEILETDTAEFNALYHDLLVEVTEFFRDPQAFDFLKKEIVPNLLSSLGVKEEVRIWAPGAATGEEAYSIAMVI